MTYKELKARLDELTDEQLNQSVIWCGDERGGHVTTVWEADEDVIGDPGDGESWLGRSQVTAMGLEEDYADADVCIPAGTIHLLVD